MVEEPESPLTTASVGTGFLLAAQPEGPRPVGVALHSFYLTGTALGSEWLPLLPGPAVVPRRQHELAGHPGRPWPGQPGGTTGGLPYCYHQGKGTVQKSMKNSNTSTEALREPH